MEKKRTGEALLVGIGAGAGSGGCGGAALDRFGQYDNGSVQFPVGPSVLIVLLSQFVFNVEQHGFDHVELVGHLRLQIMQTVFNLS